MVTGLEHNALAQKASLILKGLGCEVAFEKSFQIGRIPVIVDVVGYQNGKPSIAIELGNCGIKKLVLLEAIFDEVVWLPYWGASYLADFDRAFDKYVQGMRGDIRKYGIR